SLRSRRLCGAFFFFGLRPRGRVRSSWFPMFRTGADLVVETLAAAGVQHLFTLSGNQILSVYDATIGKDIALIHTRHEAPPMHMPDGCGRLTEQPGVALVTGGARHCDAPPPPH